MLAPPLADNEAERLAVLHSLSILDTPAEARFDRITRIAQRLFDVPYALISLIDSDRQWFKSCQGLGASETPRDISFCGHAILGSTIFHIPDARLDARFADNPLVTGAPHIRFYAGAPLLVGSGNRIGTLCIIDDRPRQLTEMELQSLRDLADWVEDELNIRNLSAATKIIEAQESYLRAILDNVADGIITVDANDRVRSANARAACMFGHTSNDLCGVSATNITGISFVGDASHAGPQMATGTRKDGSTFPLELRSTEMQRNGGCERVVILRDLTQHHKVEQLKNEFISIVSHELRTPLTSIRGSLGLIAGGHAGAISDQAKGLIDIAYRNCERLVRLVSDLLDMEKARSHKLELTKINQPLQPLVQQAIEANQSYATTYNVTLELTQPESPVTASVDADRFIQVMTNLLSNAAKFSPPGGAVSVTMRHEAQCVRVMVCDRGPGIQEEFKTRVFDKFSQADASPARAKGGTGLGLSIAKAIVELHNGVIGFEPNAGGGTCFYFDLPVVPA